MAKTITTHSEADTAAVGRDLARALTRGAAVLVSGDLGAGKTAFVRGLAEGLGIDPADVTSPTFTLIQEYRSGRVPLFHVDLYRLNDAREIEELGLEMADEGVLAIEWAEKLSDAAGLKPSRYKPPSRSSTAVSVRIQHGDGDTRTIVIEN